MPLACSVSGTVTRVAAGGSPATGTLDVGGYSTGGATGTLSVDRSVFSAFIARVRLTRPDLYIDDELMANLVDTVKLDWSLDDPVAYAELTVSDKRASFLDLTSVSYGSLPVEIDLWAGPPGGVKKWEAFFGNVETSTNTMPYRTRGNIRAVSLAALWANTQGCLNIPAMSGLTRGAAIAAFAESAGVSIANAAAIGGGIITKPLDLAGKTPFQLIQEWGEVEGWFARATPDGSALEIVNEETMLSGEPVFYFDESNTLDCPETTPDRPVTDWILSGTQLGAATGSGIAVSVSTSSAVDGDGNRATLITEITTDNGVEIRRVVTQWATLSPPGTIVNPLAYLIVSRVTTVSTWEPFSYVAADGTVKTRPSTQLNTRITTTEELSAIPNMIGGYAWLQGGCWNVATAELLTTKQVTEWYYYTDCFQDSSIITTYAYYSPQVTYTTYPYPDGTYRALGVYEWRAVSKVETHWQQLALIDAVTNIATAAGYLHFVGTTGWVRLGPDADETYATSYTTTDADTPPTGAASNPQFGQQLMVAEYDATVASGYAKLTQSATIDFAENPAELDSMARRRIRRACSDTIALPHKLIPFLQVGDHVSVTMHSRSLVDVDAYVYSIERTAAVLNGGMDQVTTVKIPPSWI